MVNYSITLALFNLKSNLISPPDNLPRIVGIGTSAGGLDALERFLQTLPANTGLAYVIVQHLSIDHESHMAELLRRQTTMEVVSVTNSEMVRPNVVYVRRPKEELKVNGARLEVVDRITEGVDAFYPIDRFFISLAQERQERSIGLILSGMGTDGSRGVDAIKEKGGLIMIQSPLSAQFTGMPNSAIQHISADLVAPPEQLAQRLAEVVELERTVIWEDKEDIGGTSQVRALVKLIQRKTGLDFSQYRPSTIRRRIEKRMLIAQIASNQEYLDFVTGDAEECETLAQSFLIGVTRFFRDREAFEQLREKVIPELFAHAVEHQPVRVWIPACSTGEEAYSMALMIEEYLRENGLHYEYKILASDVDPTAVQVADRGYYFEHITADLPADLLGRYFHREVGGYRIKRRVRDRILFAVQDLLHDPPFIRVDLISCRNFLIYINVEAQARILSTFHFALNPNAFLLLGPSESLGKLQNAFSTVDRRWKLYSRRPNDSVSLPSIARAQSSGASVQGGRSSPTDDRYGVHDEDPTPLPSNQTAFASNMVRDPFAQYLADRYAPITLFVDAKYEIVYINGDVDGLLHFPRQHASFNLKRVLDTEVSSILSSVVDTLLIGGKKEELSEVNIPDVRLRDRAFSVSAKSARLSDRADLLVAVILHPVEVDEQDEEGIAKQTSSDELIRRRIQSLEEQLLQSNMRTQKLLSELEATNEELQTSNRELLASNEEMQSTNEELQSVNEELYTVNNEIQQKNEQLKLLNSDINNLLESTEIGTVFLDDNLLIRRFTPSIHKQFDLHASDVGRPISAFTSSFSEINIAAKCRGVLASLTRYEEEITDDKGQEILIRILPYRSQEETKSGLVVTFININDLAEARRELMDMATKYQALLQYSQDTIVIVGSTGKMQEINKWLEKDTDKDELIGTYFVDRIEDYNQRALFEAALRKVFDEQQPNHLQLTLKGSIPTGMHLDLTFISAHENISGDQVPNPQVMLIMRDISAQITDAHYTKNIIQEYRTRLEQKTTFGGLMDLEGNIIYINDSGVPELGTENFVNHKVTDFLSPSGRVKFKRAIERLANGSFKEEILYSPDDLTIPPVTDIGTRVTYHPIIADNEVRLIGLDYS